MDKQLTTQEMIEEFQTKNPPLPFEEIIERIDEAFDCFSDATNDKQDEANNYEAYEDEDEDEEDRNPARNQFEEWEIARKGLLEARNHLVAYHQKIK